MVELNQLEVRSDPVNIPPALPPVSISPSSFSSLCARIIPMSLSLHFLLQGLLFSNVCAVPIISRVFVGTSNCQD